MLYNKIKFKHLLCFIATIMIVSCSSNNKDIYSSMDPKQIYNRGKLNIKKKNFPEAAKDFEALEANYPYGDDTDKAKLSLIYSYYEKKDYPQLKLVAERFLKMNPNHVYADYAQYMLGVADYDQYYSTVYRVFNIDRSKRESGLAISAFDAFKVLLENFPKSKYALDARHRMLHLRNQIAFNELHIAEYYLNRESYVAASNRAYSIVTNFSGTPAVSPALKIMAKAYNKLDMPEFELKVVNLTNNQ